MASFLARNWFLLVVALGAGAALLFPGPAHAVTDYWEPRSTIGISLFLVAWTMPTHSLLAECKRPYAALWAVFLSYGIMPITAWSVGLLIPNDDLRVGLILISAVPCTLSSAILWTRMAGGNEATALLTVVGTTFTSWFLTTAWLYALTGTSPQFDGLAVMLVLFVSLILPVGIGQLVRLIPFFVRTAERHKLLISALSQLFVLAIIIKASVTVGDTLDAQDAWLFVWSILLAVGLHLFVLGSGFVTSRWLGFDRGRQIAVAFAASQKTLQISLVLYDQYYKEAHPFAVMPLLFYHVGQLLLDTVIAKHLLAGASPRSNETRVVGE